jgi:hypothetical protein
MTEKAFRPLAESFYQAREKGGQILKEGIYAPEKKAYVRYILAGQLPAVEQYQADLHAGILISDIIVNRFTRNALVNPQIRAQIIEPYYPKNALDYALKYIDFHGLAPQTPPLSRTDMLLTTQGLKAIEINPDAPEGYALSQAGEYLMEKFSTGEHSCLYQFFHFAQKKFLNQIGKEKGEVKALIPYWAKGSLTPIDAQAMSDDLRSNGYDVEAVALEELQEKDATKFNCVLRIFSTATTTWEKNKNLPFFQEEEFLKLPQYPAPWTDIAGLKHWLAILYQSLMDPLKQKQLLLSAANLQLLNKVLLPTFSPIHYSPQQLLEIYYHDKNRWVAKQINSSHGEGFRDKPESIEQALISGNFILQEKADCLRVNHLIVLNPDVSISEQENWLVDMDPMGYVNHSIIACVRACFDHPMNVAGENGGGFYNPLYFST